VLLADLDHVDGPRKSRLVGVRWVATGDEHAPRGIEPALDVVVYVLASHALVLMQPTDTQHIPLAVYGLAEGLEAALASSPALTRDLTSRSMGRA
jgi:hypothetical protein